MKTKILVIGYGDIAERLNHQLDKSAFDVFGISRQENNASNSIIWDWLSSDLPKLKNPRSGWLQNANDPPWTSTIPIELFPKNYPGYMAPKKMDFRPQRSARMILEDNSITFDELVNYKLSTRVELADRILDDLFKAIDTFGSKFNDLKSSFVKVK